MNSQRAIDGGRHELARHDMSVDRVPDSVDRVALVELHLPPSLKLQTFARRR
jgi:hypothetical protein